MKKNQDYYLYGNYCLRMPSLPISGLYDLNDTINKIDLNDPVAVMDLIDELFSTPIFREAIFTSSMDLYARFQILKKKEQPSGEE